MLAGIVAQQQAEKGINNLSEEVFATNDSALVDQLSEEVFATNDSALIDQLAEEVFATFNVADLDQLSEEIIAAFDISGIAGTIDTTNSVAPISSDSSNIQGYKYGTTYSPVVSSTPTTYDGWNIEQTTGGGNSQVLGNVIYLDCSGLTLTNVAVYAETINNPAGRVVVWTPGSVSGATLSTKKPTSTTPDYGSLVTPTAVTPLGIGVKNFPVTYVITTPGYYCIGTEITTSPNNNLRCRYNGPWISPISAAFSIAGTTIYSANENWGAGQYCVNMAYTFTNATGGMVLVSNAKTRVAHPSYAIVDVLVNASVSFTANTDLTLAYSTDGGVTWTSGSLYYIPVNSTYALCRARIDLTGATGTSTVWKVSVFNSKAIQVYGVKDRLIY